MMPDAALPTSTCDVDGIEHGFDVVRSRPGVGNGGADDPPFRREGRTEDSRAASRIDGVHDRAWIGSRIEELDLEAGERN